ncbi:reverse transcriptase domain-containing protein [Tanacetum coccineum]
MLTAPMEKEELIVYLAAVKETVSATLMQERKAKQMPIYFVSRALRGLELNYTSMEKLVLALVHASKCLKRVSVKGKIKADFIVERPEEDSPDTLMESKEELPDPWILFTDGSSCTDSFGAGLILINPEGMEFAYALIFRFDATNNKAEYEALIAGLRIAEQMGVKNLQAYVDSQLVANQVNGIQVPKSENKKADALSKIASTSFAHLSKQVLVEELKEKSISKVEVLAVVEEEGDTWMTPILEYLTEEPLPTCGKLEGGLNSLPLFNLRTERMSAKGEKIVGKSPVFIGQTGGASVYGRLERITKKRTKNKAKTTKPGTEWKSCEGQSQSKAKDQKSQSQKSTQQINSQNRSRN